MVKPLLLAVFMSKLETGTGMTGIPFLKDIPFLNMLFNQTYKIVIANAELLVFITPKLLDSHE